MSRYRPERWGLLALALSAAACAGSMGTVAPEPTGTRPPEVVSFETHEVRAMAELLRAEDRREFDEVLLRANLAAKHPELRRRAARAAGRIGDPGATLILLEALADPDAEVRAEAAFALGQLGDTSAHVIGALTARALAPAEAVAPRVEAVAALGKLRTVEARIAIESIVERAAAAEAGSAPPTAVVAEALLAIWKFRRTAGLTDPVVPLTRALDPEIRWRATYALMRLGDPATVPALIARRSDDDPLVRALVMRGLRPAVVDSAGRRAIALETLVEGTRDPHPHVRINALRALASYRLDENTATLARALEDPDTNVALAAAEALAASGSARAGTALEPVARNSATPLAVRAAALAGTLRLAPERGFPIVRELARSDDWLTRIYATRALGSMAGEQAITLLSELVRDPDPRVVGAALGTLGQLPVEATPGLRRIFIEQLGAADVGVRAAALRALAKRASAADLALLLDAYERAIHDREMNDAARAAIAALGSLASQGVPVRNSFFRRFERSHDPIVRREVGERIGEGRWGAVHPIATERDLAFYEEIVRTLVVPDLVGDPRPRIAIHTEGGPITIELAAAEAPLTVYNFIALASRGYFDGHRWHRVVPNFVLQDGDPRGDGSGGPGYSIRDEINRLRYLRGTVGMALDGADTGGSQYFITHAPQPHLDGGYTIFGTVVAGIEVADRIAQDDPIHRMEVVHEMAPISAAHRLGTANQSGRR